MYGLGPELCFRRPPFGGQATLLGLLALLLAAFFSLVTLPNCTSARRHSKIAVTMEIYTEVPSAAIRAALRCVSSASS